MPETNAGDASSLARLCAACGITTSYVDIWGKQHTVEEANLVALLAEFGIDASTTEAITAAERDTQAAQWRSPLPPVAAICAGATPWTLPLRLPATIHRCRWIVVEEGGARHTGEADVDALEETGFAELDGAVFTERRLAVAVALSPGYHRLSIDGLPGETLVVCPPTRCYLPPALADGGRIWGPTVQLYALRSERNWGLGDLGDLAKMVEFAAEHGAGIVGVNPLHALFPHNPAHASPYSPSSRMQLNVLYIEVEAIEEFRECEAAQDRVRTAEFQARLAQLRDAALVDYAGVATAKFEILELLYAHLRKHHLDRASQRGVAFREYQRQRGRALRLHAIYEALQAQFHDADNSVSGWSQWPGQFRDHNSRAVAGFAETHIERVEFYEYLQWQAESQLARIGERCRELGLAAGLYLDLAVSVDRAGSDTWTNYECYALGASVGAPPDEFNPNGQCWGLPPLRPDRLRAEGYRIFINALRENMRHSGALRIDHVMGLMRLFWIPAGKTASEGAYVHYALDEMLAIVALESERNRCMVIGEDLGTVADEMRAGLARIAVQSYRLLYFERGEGGVFKQCGEYPRDALVAVSTHDLATLAGWWVGRDLRLRLDLGLFPDEDAYEKQVIDRTRERMGLLLALRQAGFLPPDTVIDPTGSQSLTPELVEAIHAFAAATPARVMMLQIEDAIGFIEQANMPGTTNEHPNWRRKLPESLEKITSSHDVRTLAAALQKIRPHPVPRHSTGATGEALVPRATYRLQFNRDFTFDDATKILPYLARLGVSHVYCAPILRARPGSTHGYDIVAHGQINPELGGAESFRRFTHALRAHGLGQLLDMVPNHMGVLGADNDWWMDVLENGCASVYAQYFDIDWHPVNSDLEGKVLVPVLGDHYGNVLAGGDLVVGFERDAGAFALRYFDHRFPLDPCSYPALLSRAETLVPGGDARDALSSLAAAFGHLPSRAATDASAIAERVRDKEIHKGRLARLAGRHPEVIQAINATLADLNASGPHDALHSLIEMQAYRLAYWRVATDEINYRRFFDINDLAALRMESEQVFEATHAFVLDLAASGIVDGLRIDHPDGLYDPAQYFRRLQEGYARRVGIPLPACDARGRPSRPLYVAVEKIVAPHEDVPESWHVHGTTGYRFAMVVNGILVDSTAKAKFDRVWHAFTRQDESFEELAYLGKRAIMRSALASELTVLSAELLRIARADRRTRDYTFNTLREALAEVTACMPVYRTYIIDAPSGQDLRYVNWAIAHARRRSRAADISIFDFVRQSLLGQAVDGANVELQSLVRHFAIRFQQFTSPVAAKGVEDTAFYRYNRLVSLNEVGGDPGQFGMTVRAFHGASTDRAARWPHTMLATSTHDNKRSEDVRNRINVLSEMPAAWRLALRNWSQLNRGHRTGLESGFAPSPADEYLLYQTLLGVLPAQGLDEAALRTFRERIERYALKAAREAKTNTSWISPNEDYERGLTTFIRALLGRVQPNPFLDDLRKLVAVLAWFGALNSIAMTTIKLTSPGVPDLYQGCEMIDLSLVDPDNRRPVDYAARGRLMDEFEAAADGGGYFVQSLLADPMDGRAKFWTTWRLLVQRRRTPDLFRDGSYLPLQTQGERASHVVAYARQHGDATLVVIAGRLFAKLLGEAGKLPLGEQVWGGTRVAMGGLPDGTQFRNVLTGEKIMVERGSIALSGACATFPVATLLATWKKGGPTS